jgi:protein-S-isoprenylcysteine O-methyltransferase
MNEETSDQQLYEADGKYQANLALISVAIGIVFSLGLGLTFLIPNYSQLGLYIAGLAVFHFLEFYVTAIYNPRLVSLDSFLFNNGNTYTFAHCFAVVESIVEYWFFPHSKSHSWLTIVGITVTVVGQVVRTMAMKQAGSNFSHSIANVKVAHHQLVTKGIYSWSRHPSYCGFFYWALGTQITLCNPVAFVVFSAILWRFFSHRIKYEEARLVQFFGDDYIKFRSETPTRIPFIK